MLNSFTYFCVSLASAQAATMPEPFVVAIGGGSRSGKTFLARRIQRFVGRERAIILSLDNYYAADRQPCVNLLRGKANFDHPSAYDFDAARDDLRSLKAARPTYIEKKDSRREGHDQNREVRTATDFIIFEGLFVLNERFSDLVDYGLFVDADSQVRLQRRIRRGSNRLNRDANSFRIHEIKTECRRSRFPRI